MDVTIRLVNLAVKSNLKGFVFVSSIKAGWRSDFGVCTSEKEQGDPKGIYGKTKLDAELKLLKIGKEAGMYLLFTTHQFIAPELKGFYN